MLLLSDTHGFNCIFRFIWALLFDVRTREEAMRMPEALTEANIKPSDTAFLLNNIHNLSSYLTGNTLRLCYKAQPVNAV
jgi:hypothetical protein